MDYTNYKLISWEKYKESPEIMVFNGDILLVKTGSSYGKCAIVSNLPREATINPQFVILKYVQCNSKYLTYVLQSSYARNIFDDFVLGTAIPTFTQVALENMLIPLPPLNEQDEIVIEIDNLLSLVNGLINTKKELTSNIKLVKSKILELAISGKLVPQDPADEPAEELLRRINPSAVPADKSHYNIPSSWVWVKLEDIFEINPKNNNINDDDECGFVPMANVQDGYSGKHTFEVRKWREVKKGYCHFQNGDIAVAKISPCFENLKSVIIRSLPNNIGAGTTELVILRCKKVFAPYFLYLFKSQWYISKGTVYFKGVVGQQRVNRDIFTKLAVPLPPLNEQKRIVTKVDELFSLIDTIQQSLEA